ncbi:MAG: LTA synthase family protein [Bacteroidales bacterium]|nr:LTA synthase family protein [Bacteroidales bacterium]
MVFVDRFLKKFWNISVIVKLYIIALSIFTAFRIVLFITEIDKVSGDAVFINTVKAFLMGVRFDIVICGYILLLPFLLLSLMQVVAKPIRVVNTIVFVWVFALFTLAFAISSADIPYFNHFFNRLNTSAFLWMDSPVFVFKMIFQEPRFFLYFIPFLVAVVLFYKLIKRTIVLPTDVVRGSYITNILVFVMFTAIIFVGIRGRVQKKSPIRVGTAYFCNNPFLNQLGLNPAYTLLSSYRNDIKDANKRIALIDDQKAIDNVRKYLNIVPLNDSYPIARRISTVGKPNNYNVVVIIMESMGFANMKAGGNPLNLTPFLDSIAHEGIFFNNIYTAGIHTFNGVFGTTCSFPSIFNQHHLKHNPINRYNGMGNVLKTSGYSTLYFTTHDGQFDNIEGFMRANDFDHITTQADYPANEVKTTLGVPDDYLFRFSLPALDDASKQDKPFLAVYLTASIHEPYYLPPYYDSKQVKMRDKMTDYADWSIRQFIEAASERDWFDSTIFVMIADHGRSLFSNYDLSLDFHHTPLIFYAPNIITEHKTYSSLGGQIDVFPTIMGILNIPYVNNTFGVDLLKQSRDFIVVNHDDRYAVINHDYLLVANRDGRRKLYDRRSASGKDYSAEQPSMVETMDAFGKSNLQVFQYMLLNNKLYFDTKSLY